MPNPLRILISHSSDDSALAKAVSERLPQPPHSNVLVDLSGLEAGKPWRRQLHEWMARCGAGLVLLTPAVLARPEWVLKECIILGWRLDLEPTFSLFFALAPGMTRDQFDRSGFRLAQLTETQFLPGNLADFDQVEALVDAVRARLPPVQPATPYDDLIQELKTLLIMADPQGATYAAIGAHLGIEGPANWGPDKRDMLADAIVRAIVRGRDQSFAMDELLNHIGTWTREHRSKLINLLVPYWIEPDTASELLHRAPPRAPPQPAVTGPGALTIQGAYVPEFTASMTVRRAYGARLSGFRLAEAVGLGGDNLFREISKELCDHARQRKWVAQGLKDEEKVVEALRKSLAPVFVPLAVLPDPETIRLLRARFPRMLFLAPRPGNRAAREDDELRPDPPLERESAEYSAWDGAMNAIDNG
jgi:hypothetical protein